MGRGLDHAVLGGFDRAIGFLQRLVLHVAGDGFGAEPLLKRLQRGQEAGAGGVRFRLLRRKVGLAHCTTSRTFRTAR